MKANTYYHKIISLFLLIFLIFSIAQVFLVQNSQDSELITTDMGSDVALNTSATNPIPDFWNLTEIENIPLNLTLESTSYFWHDMHQKNFTIQTLFYTSQYWNDSALRIYGVLIFPDNTSGDLGQVPGILALHGMGGTHESMLDLAYFAAAYNYSVLAIDFPGFGNSSGPPSTQEWIVPDLSGYDGNITADLLNHTHFYLTARAAIRGIDVLLNQSVIDPTRIAVTGSSYGGLNTMLASNIYGHKVHSAISSIAVGNFGLTQASKQSFFRLIVNPNEVNFNEYPYSDYFQYFDPINYVNSSNNPPTMFFLGTNDEFSSIAASNGTYFAVHNSTKALSITPGGHHGWMIFKPIEGTFLYWLNHTLWDGPAPPTIQTNRQVESTFFGSKLSVTVNVSCDAPISKVILASRWDVLGAAWKEREMSQLNQTTWTIDIKSLPFNAELTYFVMVEIEGDLYVMFSTTVWQDSLNTWLGIPFFILICLAIGLPTFLLVRRNIKKTKSIISPENERKLNYLYGSQVLSISATEIIIAWTLFLPIAVILPESGQLEFSIATLLTQYIDLLPVLTPILFGILIAGFILAFSKPILGGFINLIIPILILLSEGMIIAWLSEYKDMLMGFRSDEPFFAVGFGVILMLACGIAQIVLGVFKRKYQKRLI
jgi:dienelactone hydrolase